MRARWITCAAASVGLAALTVLAASTALAQTAAATVAPSVSLREAREIARDAYIFAYPLVLAEVTRRVMTNVERPEGLRGPMNQVAHARAFPGASFADTVRPSADTLSSLMFLDVSKEPMVVSVPDSGGRYYLMPLLDAWTDVFATRGKRSSGTAVQTFAVVGPRWQGRLPKGVGAIRSPTALVVLAGRTQVGGSKADVAAVHKFQAGIKAVPLRHYGKPYSPPRGRLNPQQDMSAPSDQVERMDAATFFALLADLMKENPPHATDYPILARMKRIGIEPGTAFAPATAPRDVQRALEAALPEALKLIKAASARSGVLSSGWRTNLATVGTYGSEYLQRAGMAYAGLGANVAADLVQSMAVADADGQPLGSDTSYVLHFGKHQLPPVRAFWSLTVYDDRQLLAANPIDRYALGDRDKLRFNDDGTLDLYIQRESPGADKESNWLPAPASGLFTMTLRLYWPKPEVLDGKWSPPPLRPQEPEGVIGRALR